MAALEADGWPCTKDGFELIKQIGKGAFASVHAARVVQGCGDLLGQQVAIKVIDLEGITSDLDDIRKEVATLRLCQHPNVLNYYVSFVEDQSLWLVTQLMSKGSCLHVMTQAKRLGMPAGMREDWVGWILLQTLRALKYFHEQGQIHRDIKAGNILMDGQGHVVLADFGVSRWVNAHVHDTGTYQHTGVQSAGMRAKTFVGTPCWMAPEVMEQLDGYDFKADIWSLGITALELAKGHAPYAKYEPMKVLLYTIQNEPPSLKSYDDDKYGEETFSQNFKQFVRMCLARDPSKRPTCTTLLASKLFTRDFSPQPLVAELLDRVDDVISVECEMADHGAVDIAQLSQSYMEATAKAGFHPSMPEVPSQAQAAAFQSTGWDFTPSDNDNIRNANLARSMSDPSEPNPPVGLEPTPVASHHEPGVEPVGADSEAYEAYARKVGGITLLSEDEVASAEERAKESDTSATNDLLGAVAAISNSMPDKERA